ncbi:MAG: uroporphyrinogen decarboxylase family protein [Armatimonadota bacterium]
MTPRKRLLCAIAGRPTDDLPTQIEFTPLAAQQAARWLGVSVHDLPDVLGNHSLGLGVTGFVRSEGSTDFDAWGIGWDNTINDGFQVHVHPLTDLSELPSYSFPDPDDPRLYSGMEQAIADNAKHRAVSGQIGFCLWERYYLLRGFQNAVEDLITQPSLVEDMLDRILEVQAGIARNLVSLGIDIGYTGDDFGSQRGLLFSPELWRRYLKPRYRTLWGVFKNAGLPVVHHSCGDVRAILDDMIEIGLDVLNPVQTQAMPPDELADRWGDRLAFWGGICTQHVLPFGNPAEVEQHIAHCRATLGGRGRWVMGPSHAITSDVPRENFTALLRCLGISSPH